MFLHKYKYGTLRGKEICIHITAAQTKLHGVNELPFFIFNAQGLSLEIENRYSQSSIFALVYKTHFEPRRVMHLTLISKTYSTALKLPFCYVLLFISHDSALCLYIVV